MIKLFIDDKEVAMDSDFSADIIRENPLITSAGDYSYDIDVDLRVPQNRRIYKDFQRLNTLSSFSQRKAELIDNEKILARGTEAVLSIEENRAKIQVLSNNSELNYIFDESNSIRDLDFGTVQTRTTELAAKVSRHLYGDIVDGIKVNEAYPLVSREDFGGFGSNASFFNTPQGWPYATSIAFDNVDNLRPMPYLLYYIDKLVEVLGYSMGTCHIDRNKYKRLLVIHGYDTLEYAKMLPDWTVSKFVSEVEKFFGVVFLVDSIHKEINIVSIDSYYQNAGTEYIDGKDVLDQHDVSFDVDSEDFQVSYQNVGYKLPGSEYWQLAAIDEKVDERCARVDKSFYTVEEYDSKQMVIFYDHRRKEEWIHYEEETEGENSHYARFVNFFAPAVKDSAVARTLLYITPVKTQCSYRVGNAGGYMFSVPIPEYYENKGATLSEAIREGTSENASDRMQVAFYLGFCHFREISGDRSSFGDGVTQCVTTRYQQLYNVDWQFTAEDCEDLFRKLHLELRGSEGRCATELNIGAFLDGTQQFKIQFVTNRFLDPRKKFVIANRLFYCQQLHYKLENGKMSGIVEGIFWPAKADESHEEPQSELDLYLGSLQGQEENAGLYANASDSPWGTTIRAMGRFSSSDNGFDENKISYVEYSNAEYPHIYFYMQLRASWNTYYNLDTAKVTKFVNGSRVSVTDNPQMSRSPQEILADSSPFDGLAAGNEIAYVLEGMSGSTMRFGVLKLQVVD